MELIVRYGLGEHAAIIVPGGGGIAGFSGCPEGKKAFAIFKEGLARAGGTLRTEHGEYLVGDAGQLS